VYYSAFHYELLSYLEQDNVANSIGQYNYAINVGGRPIKIFVCPADSSHNNGLTTTGYSGYTATSYSANSYVFSSYPNYVSNTAQQGYLPRYTIGNIPDGTSNTIAMSERLADFTYYGWSSTAWCSLIYGGWQYTPAYGYVFAGL